MGIFHPYNIILNKRKANIVFYRKKKGATPANKKSTGKSVASKKPGKRIPRGENPNPHNRERFYVTNKSLLAEMIKWRDSAEKVEDRDKPSEELGRMFMEIARRITNHSCFRNYPPELKEDLAGYAIEKMLSGLKNFNFKYNNPFAYFTSACFNAFKTQLSKHYRQVNIRRDLSKKMIAELEAEMPGSSIAKSLQNGVDCYTGEEMDD